MTCLFVAVFCPVAATINVLACGRTLSNALCCGFTATLYRVLWLHSCIWDVCESSACKEIDPEVRLFPSQRHLSISCQNTDSPPTPVCLGSAGLPGSSLLCQGGKFGSLVLCGWQDPWSEQHIEAPGHTREPATFISKRKWLSLGVGEPLATSLSFTHDRILLTTLRHVQRINPY